ncbi:MAG: Blp family class II bacteriocin [Candidatus Berkiella sp.]
MRELSTIEAQEVNGGANFFNVVSGAVFGAVIGAVMGIPLGPAGVIAGAGHGAFEGIAGALIIEGGNGLAETLHGH